MKNEQKDARKKRKSDLNRNTSTPKKIKNTQTPKEQQKNMRDSKKNMGEKTVEKGARRKQTWRAGNMLYPLPVVMVSMSRPGETANIITVAWAGTINSDPVMLSISVRKERYSHAILCETKEFVVNLVHEPLVRACDYCGVRSGRDVDKFAEMKLTPATVDGVCAPAILESPVNLACKVKEIIPLGSHDMFLAEVVSVTVDEKYMDEKGTFHLNDSGLVAYSHGTYYKLGREIGTFGYSVRKNQKR